MQSVFDFDHFDLDHFDRILANCPFAIRERPICYQ